MERYLSMPDLTRTPESHLYEVERVKRAHAFAILKTLDIYKYILYNGSMGKKELLLFGGGVGLAGASVSAAVAGKENSTRLSAGEQFIANGCMALSGADYMNAGCTELGDEMLMKKFRPYGVDNTDIPEQASQAMGSEDIFLRMMLVFGGVVVIALAAAAGPKGLKEYFSSKQPRKQEK